MKAVGIAYPAQNPVLGEAQERFDGGGGREEKRARRRKKWWKECVQGLLLIDLNLSHFSCLSYTLATNLVVKEGGWQGSWPWWSPTSQDCTEEEVGKYTRLMFFGTKYHSPGWFELVTLYLDNLRFLIQGAWKVGWLSQHQKQRLSRGQCCDRNSICPRSLPRDRNRGQKVHMIKCTR